MYPALDLLFSFDTNKTEGLSLTFICMTVFGSGDGSMYLRAI
jgi:hypothetical protein